MSCLNPKPHRHAPPSALIFTSTMDASARALQGAVLQQLE